MRGWCAWLRPQTTSSANFFRAAKAHEKKELTRRPQRTQSPPRKKRNLRDLMTETENVARQPGVDGPAQLVEFAGKKMIDAFDDHEAILAGEGGNERFDFFNGPVFIVASVHEQLGFVAMVQE